MSKSRFNSMSLTPPWAVVSILVLFFGGLGSVPLTDLDEGAFAEASREMLERGDWISPWLLDAPRFDKPVLIHWLQMVSFSVFGVNAWAARLPSALAGIIWVGSIGFWARAVSRHISPDSTGDRAGLSALIISGTSLGVLAISRASTADAVLNALLALSLLFLWKSFYEPNGPTEARRWARWAACWIGLGMLAKGPIALLVPGAGAVFAALSLGKEGWRRFWALLADFRPWLIVVAIAGPWYWLQFEAQGDAFLQGFFGTHNLGRFTSAMHGFSHGPWYYPVWTLVALLPWAPILLWAVVSISNCRFWQEKPVWMCWGVFLFVVIFFTFSATKLPHYGFYGMSGLLVLMGLLVDKALSKHSAFAPIFIAQRAFSLLGTLMLSSAPLWWRDLAELIADPYYIQVFSSAAQIIETRAHWFLLPVILIIPLSIWHRFESIFLGGAVFCATLYLGLALPLIDAFRSPIIWAANVVRAETGIVITWRLTAPSLSFEANRVIKSGDPTPGSVVVMHTKDHDLLKSRLYSTLNSPLEVERLWSQGGLQVVRIR